MALVPGDDYNLRDYLADTARAFGRYWIDQKRTYWPNFHGQTPHYTPLQWVGRIVGFCANAVILGFILWIFFGYH